MPFSARRMPKKESYISGYRSFSRNMCVAPPRTCTRTNLRAYAFHRHSRSCRHIFKVGCSAATNEHYKKSPGLAFPSTRTFTWVNLRGSLLHRYECQHSDRFRRKHFKDSKKQAMISSRT